jgi:5-formyltetrahydrofolate cyclo-ligase
MSKIDLVIAPGIAFDKNKSRLGRGKGYYDRFFINKRIVKIGVGFDFQLLESIPVNQFDIKMDKIITPSFSIE